MNQGKTHFADDDTLVYIKSLEDQVAASQAREKVILELLNGVEIPFNLHEPLHKALSQDTSALDELLAKEREKLLKIAEAAGHICYAGFGDNTPEKELMDALKEWKK